MLLARAGLRVLALDRGQPGTDTLSTHALMRGGVLQLHRWGLLGALEETATPAIRTATFHYGEEEVPVAIKPRDGVDALYAPRRTVLDPLLVRAATASGARVVHGATVVDLLRDGTGRVAGVLVVGPDGRHARVEAPIVIGADGMHSRVAALAGAEVERAGAHATALVYGHLAGLEVDGYHWHYRPGVSAGVIPTNEGKTCVFVAMPPRRFHEARSGGVEALYRRVLDEAAPGLASALFRARLERKPAAFAGARGFFRRAWGPGWALVGDAGYFKDPLTAHGITDALRDAELLARAIADGSDGALAAYQARRDEVSLGLFEVTDRIASFEWDLDQARRDHHALARHMAAESEMLLSLDGAPETARDGAAPPQLARAG
jgi:flavin-dependent dehydrogenase